MRGFILAVSNYIMNEETTEITEETERLMKVLPESVKQVFRQEAVKRGMPVARLLAEGLKRVAEEIAGNRAAA